MTVTRSLTYGLIVVIVLLLVVTLPGEKGIIRGYQLHRELTALKKNTIALEQENAALTREATMLRDNMTYIENVIVKDLNLVRPGDTIVVFKKKKS
jgi:cell division protein FtsB